MQTHVIRATGTESRVAESPRAFFPLGGTSQYLLAFYISVLCAVMIFPFVPFPFLPVMVFVTGVTFLFILGVVDFRKMVVAYLFLIPLININFLLIGYARFREYVWQGTESKGVHFDGVSLILVVAFGAIQWVRGNIRLPREKVIVSLWMTYLLFLVLSILVNSSFRPFVQLWAMTAQFAYFGVFLIFLSVAQEEEVADSIIPAMILGGTLASMSVVAGEVLRRMGVESVHFDYWSRVPLRSLIGTINHRNYFGAFEVLILPLTILWSLRKGAHRGIWVACIFIQVTAVVIAGSKGAMVAFLVVGLVLAVQSGREWDKWWAVFLGICVVLAIIWPGILIKMKSPLYSSVSSRLYIVWESIPMVRDRLLLGRGLDSFKETFLEYEKKKQAGKELPSYRLAIDGRIMPTAAHDSYLNKLTETGLGGTLAFIALLLFVLYRLRPLPGSRTHGSKPTFLFAQASVAGFCVQALTEDLFSYSKLVVPLWALVALGVQSRRKMEVSSPQAVKVVLRSGVFRGGGLTSWPPWRRVSGR